MIDDSIFYEKCSNLKQPWLLYQSALECTNFVSFKETIVLLSYHVNEAFCCTNGLYEMKN